jgi:molecular chaperone GrpE
MEEKQVITEQGSQLQQDVDSSGANNFLETTETLPSLSVRDVVRGIPVLIGEMQSLRQDFETKVKYDESKERLIDTLHQELQDHREGLHFKILRPVFIDLIAMYDDLAKVIGSLDGESSDLASQRVQNFQSFQETLEEILRRNGVDVFEVEEDLFIGSKQRVLRTIENPDPLQDRRVARRVRKGFSYENKVLRPEAVEVYRYVPAPVV